MAGQLKAMGVVWTTTSQASRSWKDDTLGYLDASPPEPGKPERTGKNLLATLTWP